MENQLYSKEFYESLQEGSWQSAREIIPLVIEMIQPMSVVDVGCGVGTWLAVFEELGIQDYLGIDGEYVDQKMLQIPQEKFLAFDLKRPIQIERKFDLVVSLEVAEHLPVELAEMFVDSLTNLGAVVLFSAAVPYQGGTGHLNEQWPHYWAQHFQEKGYIVIDGLRQKIWNNDKVEHWYAQNILIFVRKDCLENYPFLERELKNTKISQLSIIHPGIYLNSLYQLETKVINSNPLGILNLIESYQKNSSNTSAQKTLRQVRNQIANFWLNTVDNQLENVYISDVGKAHQILLNSGIKDESLTDSEQAFSEQLLAKVSRGFDEPNAINYLLAAMLYYRADQLPLEREIPGIPQWLLDDYLKFLFKVPGLFQECGEVESYYQYMQRWVDYIHINIFSNPESELWQRLAFEFTGTNFIPLYFSWANLRDIYTKRADIIEFALKTNGHQIDYEFPDAVFNREKIRLGVLKGHFNPQTETFSTLPAFEYLDRNKFEIILYALDVNGHPLEQYCQSRVDRLVKLPDNLPSQVHTIRADDLDILLIGTNVTAVTNAITLLVLHRLARVQATLYSSPVTTGMRNVDYYISGNLTEPVEGAQEHYREQLITLDGTGYCFNYNLESAPSPNKPNRKKLGISEQSVVFISGSNFYKIIPELRETWAKIIAAVPDSVLVLYPFSPSWSSSYAATSFVNRMHTVFSKYGIEKSRLLVLDSIPIRADVKEYLRLGDVYLDSYPYTGSLSTSDPLEVGLPPVVMDGNTLRSRQGPALLRELQMPDLIADSELSYIQLAVALGTNPELRKLKSNQIKHKMERNPRFLDSRSYSAQIGTLVQQLFRNHLAADLSNKLPLRDFNLIIFPDWSQPEDSLSQDLARVIRAIATHPDRSYMTLLIDTSNISDEEANLVVSGVAMNLLMEEDLDITERAEISLIGNLSEICWEALLPHLHARIVLENENEQASAKARVDTLPSYKLDSFSNTQIGKN